MSPLLSIRFANDDDDINTIGYLAQQIWPYAYGDIISPEQLRYMLNLFYSPAPLRRQMKEDGQQFVLLEQDSAPVGFAAWSPTAEPGIYKLHKIYVLPGNQGTGMGKTLLNFIFETIRAEGATELRLNVNRGNKARGFYERIGFTVLREEDIEIGNGYYMNDYVMEILL